MCFQPCEYNEVISDAWTGRDLFWLKTSIAMVEKYQLAGTGLEDSRGGNNELTSQAGLHIDVHLHARFQLESRICHSQAHTNGARCHIYLWQDLFDLSGKYAPRIRIDRNLCCVAGPQSSNIILEYLGIDPHVREIGNGVELGRGLGIHIGQSISLGDVSRNRRVDRKVSNRFSRLLQFCNLTLRDIPLLQSLFCRG